MPVPIRQIAEVALVVTDLDRTIPFDTEVLGLPFWERGERHATVRRSPVRGSRRTARSTSTSRVPTATCWNTGRARGSSRPNPDGTLTRCRTASRQHLLVRQRAVSVAHATSEHHGGYAPG